jgi:hypothetical protein
MPKYDMRVAEPHCLPMHLLFIPGICDEDIGMCWCPPETRFGLKIDQHHPRGDASARGKARPLYW